MIPRSTRPVLSAYWLALRAQFTGKMLLLSAVPLILSLLLWGVLLYVGFEPLSAYIRTLFEQFGGFKISQEVLGSFGMGVLHIVLVPLLAMLLLLPLMIFTALVFMGVAAMPAIVRHVSQHQFPQLEMKRGGSLVGSMLTNLTGFLIFVPLWLLTLPLFLVAPMAILAQAALWGWLTARVMSYDALADHATEEERVLIMKTHRRQLQTIGMVSGAAGALPGIVWIGGALISVLLFPVLAVVSVWIYVLIFIFTGLWFQYYCLQALQDLRAARVAPAAAAAVDLAKAPDGEPGSPAL